MAVLQNSNMVGRTAEGTGHACIIHGKGVTDRAIEGQLFLLDGLAIGGGGRNGGHIEKGISVEKKTMNPQ